MPFALNNSKIDALISPMVHKQAAGGFLDGDVFIRGVGAWDIGRNLLAHNIPLASGIVAGDDLFVISQASGTYATPAGWTLTVHSNMFNQGRIYYRLATGTAADNFLMPTNTLFVQAMMVCIGNKRLPLGTRTTGGANFQGGFLNNNSGTTLVAFSFPPPLGAQPVSMAVNLTRDPWAYAFGWMFIADRVAAFNAPTISYPNPQGMEIIGETANYSASASGIDTMLTGFYFQYKPVSIQYDSAFINFTGPVGTVNQYSQHTRWSPV